MLSLSAVSLSASPQIQSMAVANLDSLYSSAVLGWTKPDCNADNNIRAIHRFFSPIGVDGTANLAKITAKETAIDADPNSIYTVQAVELSGKEDPAVIWRDATIEADGLDPISIRPAGSVYKLAQAVEDFNSGAEKRGPAGLPRSDDEPHKVEV